MTTQTPASNSDARKRLEEREAAKAEYTPTDQGVQSAYISAMREVGAIPRPTFAAEFDRWLAAHDAEVAAKAKAEQRERIAEAIEVHMRRHDGAQIGFSAVGDAYAHAARIARGEAGSHG